MGTTPLCQLRAFKKYRQGNGRARANAAQARRNTVRAEFNRLKKAFGLFDSDDE